MRRKDKTKDKIRKIEENIALAESYKAQLLAGAHHDPKKIRYYTRYIKECRKIKKELSVSEKKDVLPHMLLGSMILFFLAMILLSTHPGLTGLVVYEGETSFEPNISLNESSVFELMLDDAPSSLRVSGSYTGNGSAQIFAYSAGQMLLLYETGDDHDFEDACIATCSLSNFTREVKLAITAEGNITLDITLMKYGYSKEQTVPELAEITENETEVPSEVVNLTSAENLTDTQPIENVTLPESGGANLPEDEAQIASPEIVIGEPVRWVKTVDSDETQLPSDAFNITVKDSSGNIVLDDVMVEDDGLTKTLAQYQEVLRGDDQN